jgi:hypothetical protein
VTSSAVRSFASTAARGLAGLLVYTPATSSIKPGRWPYHRDARGPSAAVSDESSPHVPHQHLCLAKQSNMHAQCLQ